MADLDALREQMRKRKEMRASVQKPRISRVHTVAYDSEEANRHYHLGECYDFGLEGYDEDQQKALPEYLAAAELGHTGAMTEVAADYSDSEESVLGYDLAKAEFWANKAIELGNPDGYKGLFDVFEERGLGEEAMKQLEKGVAMGSHDCIEWLAFLLYWGGDICGFELTPDNERAFTLLTAVDWDGKHAPALSTLGNLYYDKEDYLNAVRFFEQAVKAAAEDYYSIAKLGSILATKEEVRDYDRAIKLLNIAAKHGQLQAMNRLGVMLYLGDGIQQDEHAAIKWIRKAAEKGFHQAMINMYEVLIETDSAEAMHWLKRAANEGSEEAQNRLQELEHGTASNTPTEADKLFDEHIENIANIVTYSPKSIEQVLNSIQKAIDQNRFTEDEEDKLLFLQAFICFIYFKEHFFDDNFNDLEDEYYEILDKVDEYVDSMTNISDESFYLFNTANMYSVERYKDTKPHDKLRELWSVLQAINLTDDTTVLKVSFWQETATEIHDIMAELIGLGD